MKKIFLFNVFVISFIITFCCLGTWQLYRLQWKQDLIYQINTGLNSTPIKYSNPIIRDEYKKIEKLAEKKLINMAPDEFREDYAQLIDHHHHNKDVAFIVKAADVICAYLKTLEELSAGNKEFELAKKRLDKILKDYHSSEIDYFMKAYVPSFSLSLDEITQEEH